MTSQSKQYDVVIINGRVMDPETGLDAARNVGVKDGKIAAITEQAIRGAEPSMLQAMWWRRASSMDTATAPTMPMP